MSVTYLLVDVELGRVGLDQAGGQGQLSVSFVGNVADIAQVASEELE